MNLVFCFGFMILFVLTNVFGESDQIELECPQGWFVQSHIIYSKTSNQEKDFVVCLLCQRNLGSQNEFIRIEICMHNSDFFSTTAAIARANSQSNNYRGVEVNSKPVGGAFKEGQICGVNVKHREISFSNASQGTTQKICTASANVTSDAKNQVDLICPRKSTFVEIKRIADRSNNPYKWVVCVVCQINLEKSKSVTLCPATLFNYEKNIFFYDVHEYKLLTVNVSSEMNRALNIKVNYCGYKFEWTTYTDSYLNVANLIQCYSQLASTNDITDQVFS